jgi:hypothetical protein
MEVREAAALASVIIGAGKEAASGVQVRASLSFIEVVSLTLALELGLASVSSNTFTVSGVAANLSLRDMLELAGLL